MREGDVAQMQNQTECKFREGIKALAFDIFS